MKNFATSLPGESRSAPYRVLPVHGFLIALLWAGPLGATDAPGVITLPPEAITADSARLRGQVIDGDGAPAILERQIEWARKSRAWGTGKDGIDFGIIPDSAITVNGNEFSAVEERFKPRKEYRYRVLARNEFGWSDTNAVNVETFITEKRLARISISGPIHFGNVGVGLAAMQTLTISNTGNARVTISSIVTPENFAVDFNGVLAAGTSTAVTVTFTPPAPGSFMGALIVKSDAARRTNVTTVSGTASYIAPLPVAETLPAESITRFTKGARSARRHHPYLVGWLAGGSLDSPGLDERQA